MIWNGRSCKTAFILGAGATRGAFGHVVVNRKRVSAPLNGDFFKVVAAFVRAHDRDGGFRARYNRLRNVFDYEFPTRGRWPIPMEEAFSLLFVSKDFPEIYARRGRHRVPGTRREIEDFLRLTFGVLSAIELKVGNDNLYAKLASELEPGDRVLTLNYDTLMDSALVNAGWDPSKGYGLMGGTNKVTWRRRKPNFEARLKDVKLLKLHGSLNWYVRGSFAKLGKIFEAKPSKVMISERPRTNEFKKLIRQIVPPVYGKFFGHKHWRTLWSAAHESLVDAEVIVVIGCSLVDTDFHLSGMLSHAITRRKNDHNPFSKAIVVDRGLKVRRKWLHLFRGCRCGRRPSTVLRNSPRNICGSKGITMDQEDTTRALDRIARILAGLLVKDIEDGDQKAKIKRLKQCGFENSEIAEMLGTTANTVKVTVHSLKKNRRAGKAKK